MDGGGDRGGVGVEHRDGVGPGVDDVDGAVGADGDPRRVAAGTGQDSLQGVGGDPDRCGHRDRDHGHTVGRGDGEVRGQPDAAGIGGHQGFAGRGEGEHPRSRVDDGLPETLQRRGADRIGQGADAGVGHGEVSGDRPGGLVGGVDHRGGLEDGGGPDRDRGDHRDGAVVGVGEVEASVGAGGDAPAGRAEGEGG